MSNYTTDQGVGIRALAAGELDQVSGGNVAVAAFVGGAVIGGLITWTIMHPPVSDGIRAALEAKGLG